MKPRFMRSQASRVTLRKAGAALALVLAGAYGCGSDGRPDPFTDGPDSDSDGGDGPDDGSGGFPFPGDGPNDGPNNGPGQMGTPQYQDNFIEQGRPPGPPERGYTAVEGELAGEGEGEACALCADSSDCGGGACVIHMDTGETFCATACDTLLDCSDPETEECVPVEGAGDQCVPRIGTCYEFDPSAEPINPINEPPPDIGDGDGEGGAAGSGG